MNDPLDLIKHNRVVYNTIASHFSQTREYNWEDLYSLADYTKPKDMVLDLGCGNGRLYQILAKKQAQYIGLDQSEELIKIAQEKNPEVEFVVGEMSALNFPDQKFDAVYCIAALNHIPGRELQLQCLKEMYRVLKMDGKLLMTNWNLFSRSAKAKATKNNWFIKSSPVGLGVDIMVPWKSSNGEILGERYYHGFTVPELTDLFVAANFKIEDQFYSKKGEKVGVEEGGNLVSIFKK